MTDTVLIGAAAFLVFCAYVGGLLLYEWWRTRHDPKPRQHGFDTDGGRP